MKMRLLLGACCLGIMPALPGEAQSDDGGGAGADLAQELTNPIATLVTVPIQANLDLNIGPDEDGLKLTSNVQPVIPFNFGPDWNLITRTIVPIIYQEDIYAGAGSQFGLGDVLLSLFFSPNQSRVEGLNWGAGPVGLLPTATDSAGPIPEKPSA